MSLTNNLKSLKVVLQDGLKKYVFTNNKNIDELNCSAKIKFRIIVREQQKTKNETELSSIEFIDSFH